MARYETFDTQDDAGRLFDGGELDDGSDEGSRLPLLLVIGLLVVAAFGGVVWLAYTQGVQRGREDAPRMLVAASGPAKEAPANPGGAQTPFKGLKIYEQPAPTDEDTESTPPQATTVTPTTPAVTPAKPVESVATTASPKAQDSLAPAADDTGSAQRPSAPATSAATKPPRAISNATRLASTNAATPDSPPPLTRSMDVAPATAQTVADEGPALQIGAYKSEGEANAAWAAFEHKHTMVSSYPPQVKKVDLGDKGTWYRLRVAGFTDKSTAVALCEKLKADGGTCFLAK